MDEMDRPTNWAPDTGASQPSTLAPSGPAPGSDSGRGRTFRRNVVAVGVALGLTFGGLGIAAAQTDSTTTTAPAATPAGPPADPAVGDPGRHGFGRKGGPGQPGMKVASGVVAKTIGITEDELRTALRSGKSIADVAKEKGVEVAKVIAALVDEAKTRLAEDVKAGRLTQAQADERIAKLQERITKHVNDVGGRKGPGPHGPDGPGRPGPVKAGLETAAKAIGISVEDLHTELRSGKSIADVARAKGVDPAVVIKALVDEAKAKMAERAATLEARVTEHVNRAGGAGPNGPGRP